MKIHYTLKVGDNIMKILLLTFDEHEEKAIDKILATISDCVSLEAVQTIPVPALGMSFSGLKIRLHQRRVLKDGADIYLTRLEYGALCYLAAGLTTNIIANMSKEGKNISMDTLVRICETLDGGILDVIELASDEPSVTEKRKNNRKNN